ncbi:hypothetical protein Ae406Ps2_2974 [Pseudonocardia sp. Ae406_Ps2]|nr:hypothetical protein Ae406Ps2_2974 [Pseudonocardia sp. Ae406_Ps2]
MAAVEHAIHRELPSAFHELYALSDGSQRSDPNGSRTADDRALKAGIINAVQELRHDLAHLRDCGVECCTSLRERRREEAVLDKLLGIVELNYVSHDDITSVRPKPSGSSTGSST